MLELINALSISLDWVALVVIGLVCIILAVALKRWEPTEVYTILWVVGIILVVIGIIVLVL